MLFITIIIFLTKFVVLFDIAAAIGSLILQTLVYWIILLAI